MDWILRVSWERTGPWVLYDGQCAVCRRGARRFAGTLQRRGFRLATLQSAVGRHFAHGDAGEMKLVTRDLRVLGGAAALAEIARGDLVGEAVCVGMGVPDFLSDSGASV